MSDSMSRASKSLCQICSRPLPAEARTGHGVEELVGNTCGGTRSPSMDSSLSQLNSSTSEITPGDIESCSANSEALVSTTARDTIEPTENTGEKRFVPEDHVTRSDELPCTSSVVRSDVVAMNDSMTPRSKSLVNSSTSERSGDSQAITSATAPITEELVNPMEALNNTAEERLVRDEHLSRTEEGPPPYEEVMRIGAIFVEREPTHEDSTISPTENTGESRLVHQVQLPRIDEALSPYETLMRVAAISPYETLMRVAAISGERIERGEHSQEDTLIQEANRFLQLIPSDERRHEIVDFLLRRWSDILGSRLDRAEELIAPENSGQADDVILRQIMNDLTNNDNGMVEQLVNELIENHNEDGIFAHIVSELMVNDNTGNQQSAEATPGFEVLNIVCVKADDLTDGSSSCSICINDFVVGELVEQMPCLHIFHGNCIRRWLQARNSCPICRREPTLESS
ncbi:hypothetical protein KP509_07G011600 [Ceratopteris richardii]|uniref:RING-type domain-containing protein n=1 Tax=Ceratopteris richardii TaxID=49495 RepID=A0A8T2UBY6_CERRI|nr:hypothetical protein KP509_07G011600 [Ceratopteris richardii]